MFDLEKEKIIFDDDLDQIDRALRPRSIQDYIGQNQLKEKLKIAIEASNQRKEPVPHILLVGSPGLGKTTIANIIGIESEAKVISVMAPSIKSVADILELLKRLQTNDILFIDEIHALDRKVEETLYAAMEDYAVTLKLGNKEMVKIKIEPFCLIGATTTPGRMTAPLRDRFDIQYTMEFYSNEDLSQIIEANGYKLNVEFDSKNTITSISERSRGVPRVSNRLLKRIRDYAQIYNDNLISEKIVEESMNLEGIDKSGLTKSDTKYLETMFNLFKGGPAGLEAISSAIQEDKISTLETIEPFLIRRELIYRTKQGRILSPKGMDVVIEKLKHHNDI